MLKGKTVVLGVTGSIAAYKMANLTSMLTKLHCDVHVIMTKNATNIINPITFETLTARKCLVDTFDRNFNYNIEHVKKPMWFLWHRHLPMLSEKWQQELQTICLRRRFLPANARKSWHRR